MKTTPIILSAMIGAVVAFMVIQFWGNSATIATERKETAFERVMRTNTLRCSYVLIPPQISRDPNTRALSGIAYDIANEAAKRLNLKIDWVEEVTFPTVAEGLKTGRYDSFCLTSYKWAPSARVMEYTRPVYFTTTSVYVRPDDHRFDTNIAAINDKNVTVATIDGEAGQYIKAESFPLASTYSMPEGTDLATVFEVITSKKADVVFSNPLMAMPYLLTRADVIRRIDTPQPVRFYEHALSFNKGEHDLVSMFNVVLDEMLNDGAVDKILDKYERIPGSVLRVPFDAQKGRRL